MSASADELQESLLSEEESDMPASAHARKRSKREVTERGFKCGCGKTYLSYPALYTHIRNKHGKNAPAGTSTPCLEQGRGRGRPRKRDSANKDEKGSSAAVNLFQAGKAEPLSGFEGSADNQHRDVLYYKVARQVSGLDVVSSSDASCDDVFAAYLIDTAKSLSPVSYKRFVSLVQSLRRCLNAKGWFELADPTSYPCREFCVVQPSQRVPEISNTFINDFLSQDNPQINRAEAIEMILHLSEWLFSHKFSTLRLAREQGAD